MPAILAAYQTKPEQSKPPGCAPPHTYGVPMNCKALPTNEPVFAPDGATVVVFAGVGAGVLSEPVLGATVGAIVAFSVSFLAASTAAAV